MDSATQVQITGILYTIVFPLCVTGLILLVGSRRCKCLQTNTLTDIALISGILVAVLGSNHLSFPPNHADDWLFYGPLIAGGMGLLFDGPARRLSHFTWIVPVMILPLVGWQIVSRVADLWREGIQHSFQHSFQYSLLTEIWFGDALLIALVIWLMIDEIHSKTHSVEAQDAPTHSLTPILLGPLALTLVGVALIAALSGSARIAQIIGGSGAVVGVMGLMGWRWPHLRPGRGTTFSVLTLLVMSLLMIHFFVDVPRLVVTTCLIVPIGARLGLQKAHTSGRFLKSLLSALLVSAALVFFALQATLIHEDVKAKTKTTQTQGEDPESETYYPYD